MKTSYHMVFNKDYSGGLNKYGGKPTHLPKKWPQIEGCNLSFLFQLYCDEEKLMIPDTLCIQGYQLIENGDYNSDIVIVQLPLDAEENTAHKGFVASDISEGDILFQKVPEYDEYDENIRNNIPVFCSKLKGWCSEELLENGKFLGQLYDDDPFVIGANYTMCLFLNDENQIVIVYD